VFSVIQVWDLRILLVLATIAVAYYTSASIPWRAVRRNWAYVAFFITFVVVTNTLITGGELRGYRTDQLHVYFRMPPFGTPISAESVTYAIAQFLRFGAMAAMGFPLAFVIAPGDIGPTFARLKVPGTFAFALELTFRFVPSLAEELRTTIDAQRVRGYEWERRGRTPFGKIRRAVPLMVPLTVNAIVNAEDTIDAMELRAFGTGPRSWLRQLAFDQPDRLVLASFVLLLVIVTLLSVAGLTVLWVPEPLIRLAAS
jgi:energy-coupling factor transport system permease protein